MNFTDNAICNILLDLAEQLGFLSSMISHSNTKFCLSIATYLYGFKEL